MQRWRVVDPPDRWELVSALLQSPAIRQDVECFGRTRGGRLVPLHVFVEAITHFAGEPVTVAGRLTYVRDQPIAGRPPVTLQIWPQLRRGEMVIR